MPEVMFKVVALGFPGTARQGRCQGMVIFVFDFPACSSNLGKVNNIYSSDRVIGYEAVLIQDFTCSFLRDDQFQPINLQSIAAIAQGNLIGKTILLNFAMLAIPMPLCDFFYTIVLVQESDPLVTAWSEKCPCCCASQRCAATLLQSCFWLPSCGTINSGGKGKTCD
mgnify:FL=1